MFKQARNSSHTVFPQFPQLIEHENLEHVILNLLVVKFLNELRHWQPVELPELEDSPIDVAAA
ncbi:hypothetical protein M7I_2195 [Glarea lozoyensis 74030]|uniref:Uncharacterized protein n=1 Tax=Glarea lozoyensis (strain ATCC 74030 / MF5533) TaxID=1104152 RepID=H0EI47_GLAL7|nr:hypothetical protein M7I_2195 [Glarea lozoyensis 74030]